jgi:hypothetical protein
MSIFKLSNFKDDNVLDMKQQRLAWTSMKFDFKKH